MGKRTRLLATVALPIASLMLQPVEAATIRPVLSIDGASSVMTVQAEELSEEELRRQKRQRERQREGRQEQRGEDRQRAREERNQKQREAGREQQQKERAAERKADAERKAAQDRERALEERRQKRQAEAERERRNEAEAERRKKERADQERKERNTKAERRAEQERERMLEQQRQRRQTQTGQQDGRQNEAERRREREKERADRERKERAAERKADAERKAAQERERADRERRERAAERNAEAERKAAQDRERALEERRKNRQAEAERERKQVETERREERRARRDRDENRERIARDPSKTVETIDLPIVGGAAVLDSDKDWDNRRDLSREELRRKRAEERRNVKVRVPKSDADAQVDRDGNRRKPVRYESAERERGERFDRRPGYDERDGWRVERRFDDRQVINFDNRVIVRSDDSRRLSRRASETYYEQLSRGRVREVIVRPNGDRVVTIRSRYGDVIQRSRIDRSGREYVMFYAPELDRESRPTFVDPGLRLPPMRLTVPVNEYIVDTSASAPRDYREFLELPPVEEVERVYTLDEVRYSARIRDKVRRIDLDTITFATGSADVSMDQAATVRRVAEAINDILDNDPGETFLIEGHTDAVGSDESNLVLSDRRAEAVANVLSDMFDIPPENLATQGYGERYLKIDTDGPEQLNRRVTIRRVTPLVKPVAMAE